VGSEEEVKQAYRRLAFRHRRDPGGQGLDGHPTRLREAKELLLGLLQARGDRPGGERDPADLLMVSLARSSLEEDLLNIIPIGSE
jgi:hypothetical protein